MAKLKYDIEKMKFKDLKDSIEIPRFQRGLVWGKEKKRELIKTLKSGLPIGVLLLYKKEDKYLVIDGLQRFTTMKDYSNDYFSYVDKDEITNKNIMDIVTSSDSASQLYDALTEDAKNALRDSIRKIIILGITDSRGKNNNKISWNISKKLCTDLVEFDVEDAGDIQSTVFDIVDSFSKTANIDDVEIPMILFKGDESELASIYQKLNQEGVKLSKYDVFAATWVGHTLKVNDDIPFIDLIIKKYEKAEEESELDISDFDADEIRESGELTVFEYAFGIGKAIAKKCTHLLTYDESKVDSIGFVILAEILGLSYGEMGKLAEVIDTMPNLDYKILKDRIVEVCYDVEKALGNRIIAPTGKDTSLACHAELQLVSYVVVLFKLKYAIKDGELIKRTDKTSEINNFKKYLHKHYLYSILRGDWSSAGDSKLAEITNNADSCLYCLDVDKNSFEQVIIDWLEQSVSKMEQKQIPKINKLFMNYLLRGRTGDISTTKFDVEHCVPQKVIQKYFLDKSIIVPMSSLCNTVYIPVPDNRRKKDKTYYQKQDEDVTAYALNEDQLNVYLYPKRADLQFVESVATLTKDNYMDFLNGRKVVVKDAMMEVLYPSL